MKNLPVDDALYDEIEDIADAVDAKWTEVARHAIRVWTRKNQTVRLDPYKQEFIKKAVHK